VADDERRDARAVWLKGFGLFEQGEESARKAESAQALARFKQALTLFEQVKNRHPRWNSALIEYRISLCRKRIGDMEAALAKAGTPAPPEPAAALATAQARIGELEKALAGARRDLDQARAALEQARREAARGTLMVDDVKTLLAEKAELEKKAATLEAENRRLQQAATASPAADQIRQELEQRLAENETLRQAGKTLQDELVTQRQLADQLAQQKTQLEFDLAQAKEGEAARQRDRDKLASDLQAVAKIAAERAASLDVRDRELTDARQSLVREKEAAEAARRDLGELRAKAGNDDITSRQLVVENEKLLQDVEALHLRMAKVEGDHAQAIRAMEERSRRLSDLERLLASTEADRKAACEDLERVNRQLASTQTIEKKQQDRIADLEKQQAAAQDELKTVSLELGRLQEKNKTFTELALQTTKAEESNRVLQRRIAEMNTRLEAAANERQAALAGQQAAEKKAAEIAAQQAELTRRNLELAGTASQIQAMREKAERGDQLAATVVDLTRQHQEALQKAAEAEAASATLKTDLARLDTDLKAARQTAADHEKELIALREQQAAATPPAKLRDQLAAAEQAVARLQDAAKAETARRIELEAAVRDRELRLAKLAEQAAATPAAPLSPPTPSPLATVDLVKAAVEAEKAGKREAAIWQYQQILAQDPNNLDALSRLGILAAETGEDEAAKTHLEAALRQDPDDVEKLLALSFVHLRTGQHYLALGTLGRAAAQDPRNPDLQRYLGVACGNLGWSAAAEQQFKTSFELDGTNPETAFNLAVLIATSAPERIDDARTWYRKAIDLGAETDPGMEELFRGPDTQSPAIESPDPTKEKSL
jgi:hypothetical protein